MTPYLDNTGVLELRANSDMVEYSLNGEDMTSKVSRKNRLFLRHGESDSNVANTFSGSKDDAPLTTKGEGQAAQAGKKLLADGVMIDRIIASPLQRTRRTAHIIANVIGFDVKAIEIEPRLAEYDMGELTGKPRTKVTSAQLIAAPGAEDPQVFMARVSEALAELEEYPGTILIVSHAGVGRIIRCSKEGLDPASFYDLPAYPNATVVEL